MSILRRLFRSGQPEFSAPMEPEHTFYAIGDIHGCDDLLVRLLQRIEDRDGSEVAIVCLGDLADRGEQSLQVLRRVHRLSVAGGGRLVSLAGNHEEMLLAALDAPKANAPRWLRYGGLQTIAAMGIAAPSETAGSDAWVEMAAQVRRRLDEDGLVDWLRDLPLSWRSGNVTAVHAGADPRRRLDDQDRATLLWGHPDFATTDRADGQWVVHGHTVVETPRVAHGRIAVDTGAYATGRLTAARIARDGIVFVET